METELLKNNSGQAAIETVIALSGFITLLAGVLIISYLSFARVWLSHESYETLICLAQRVATNICESNLRKALQQLPFGSLHHLGTHVADSVATLNLQFEPMTNVMFNERQNLRLPILPRATHE